MKQLHEEVDGIYGYRRMTMNMNRKFGQNINHKRIYRLMKILSFAERKHLISGLPLSMWRRMY
ncbi:hypothetical protein CHH80_19510 [Bacillus sp. 7504-2]|nr:hypothetical protein CHH80_19510 [Bacillus sp. 7504-2]